MQVRTDQTLFQHTACASNIADQAPPGKKPRELFECGCVVDPLTCCYRPLLPSMTNNLRTQGSRATQTKEVEKPMAIDQFPRSQWCQHLCSESARRPFPLRWPRRPARVVQAASGMGGGGLRHRHPSSSPSSLPSSPSSSSLSSPPSSSPPQSEVAS
eukprot:gene8074-biopygen6102